MLLHKVINSDNERLSKKITEQQQKRIWPVKEFVIEYSTILLHKDMNSDNELISKKITEQQQEEKLKNTMYERVKDITKKLEINERPQPDWKYFWFWKVYLAGKCIPECVVCIHTSIQI